MHTEAHEVTAVRKKRKKRMIVAIIIVSVLAVISYILLENPKIFEREVDSKVTSMYSDKLYSYNFYPTDYDLDVTANEWYMQLDRAVHYKNGPLTVMIYDDELDSYNKAVQFFVQYFKTIVAGDADTYNTYFTDAYFEKNDPYERFAPQMLYDIEVEQLSETSNEDGTMNWSFNVKYKIYQNDGTFRNDLPSDAAKKLRFELIGDTQGNVKIDNISYYRT